MAATRQSHDQDLMLARVLQEQERAFHAMLMASIATANKTPSREQQQQVSTESLSDEELARQLQEQEDEQEYEEGQQSGYDFEAEVNYDSLSYEEYSALGDVAGEVSKGLAPAIMKQLPRITAQQHMQRQQQCSCKAQTEASQQRSAGASPAHASPGAACKPCVCLQSSTMCVVCQCDFEGSELLKLLPGCGHIYHEECINQWLAGSKACPICHKEVTLSHAGSTADGTDAQEHRP